MLSAVVVLVLAVAKFTQGAWAVVVLFPVLSAALMRLNRQYRAEAGQLEAGAIETSETPVLRHHTVLVFVDRLDLATARAIQYARGLDPDEVRAVHFLLDNRVANRLRESWERLMIRRLPLEIRECRDRRLTRAAVELVVSELADGETEVSVLLPRRVYGWGWNHLLHDRTADGLAAAIGRLPHATAVIIPYQVGKGRLTRKEALVKSEAEGRKKRVREQAPREEGLIEVPGTTPIQEVTWRRRAKIAGRVTSVEVQPWRGAQILACTLADRTGSMSLVFSRRDVPGIETGSQITAEGMVGEHEGRLAMLNPLHEVLRRAPQDPMRA